MTAAKIAELNDHLRRTFTGGRVLMTAAVAALDPTDQGEVLARVRAFADFNPDNDPHEEHDFGVVTVEGEKFFWKIDYYDLTMESGSEERTFNLFSRPRRRKTFRLFLLRPPKDARDTGENSINGL